MTIRPSNEQLTSVAFSKQAPVFDSLYSSDEIIQYKRTRVRNHLENYLPEKSHILELNCGTGEDAIYLAGKGHRVHATDISRGMQQVLMQKVLQSGAQDQISFELCSYTQLNLLKNKGPFDAVFSNFAGLNCTGELEQVLAGIKVLLKPGGILTVVVLPKFCLWEILLLFKGKFGTATRRLFSSDGRKARVEGVNFTCWYYNPSFIGNYLKGSFTVRSVEGLCTLVPPSYITYFPQKYPSIFEVLKRLENNFKNRWPWKYIGDYYILTLEKNVN
jgi:ubiquinone/menaquinone biosynthesis C-methylase UbiE